MRVAVLGGGPSPERDVSLATAAAVVSHLPRPEFEPVPVEILRDATWSLRGGAPLPPESALAELRSIGVKVVFSGLHGAWGEDGVLQGFLEVAGLPYVGSGVCACALAMDKPRAREIMAAHGVPIAAGLEIRHGPADDAAERVLGSIGLPVVVKDPVGGSSLGTFIARDPDQLLAALATLLAGPAGRALVEEYLPGRELSVPVLGNASMGGGLEPLPTLLIRPLGSDWFDYRTKYDPEAVEELCPAPIEPGLEARVRSIAVLAHRTLRCDGLTRTDFIVPEDGVPRFLEINTLPGLTPASLCPKSAAAAGIPFSELLGRLVKMARDKARREIET